jgi:phosphoribosylanthranilate isomerase
MTELLGVDKLQFMAYLRVKICGITNEADAVQAAELGADAIGLNFFKGSPRYVTMEMAKSVTCELPAFVDPVGIFVLEDSPGDPRDVEVIVKLGLRTIQIHRSDQSYLWVIPYGAMRVRWIPAFSVSENDDLLKIREFLKKCRRMEGDFPGEEPADLAAWLNRPRQKGRHFPSAVLVDARVSGQFGGTGKTIPWELMTHFRTEAPLILAGGLTPDNVAEAVRIVRPYAVDVASGVETSPGHKDAEKMKRFIQNAREAAEK